jgi:hypothetical protein
MAYAVAMNTGVAPKFILPNIFSMESRDIAGRLYAVAIPMVLWSGYPGEALDLLRKVRKYAHDANVAQRHVGWAHRFEFEALLQLGRAEEAYDVGIATGLNCAALFSLLLVPGAVALLFVKRRVSGRPE